MHLSDILAARETSVSFEFFPPKTEKAAESLYENIAHLEELKPSFVSVTYGAGGGTRDLTRELVLKIKRETSIEVMPHLTCVMHTEAEIYDLLEQYAGAGVANILALRGDAPGGVNTEFDHSRDAFEFASDLVGFVKRFGNMGGGKPIKDSRGFGIAVAGFPEGHPGCQNRLQEIDNLKRKVDAGACAIVTQLFFDNRDFYDFRDRCEIAGIDIPIIAGIMPITSAGGMKRMAELAAGARFPASLLRSVARCADDADAVRRVGVHWATEQCRDLLDHQVRGLHLYTLNKSTATREIYATLGLRDSMALA